MKNYPTNFFAQWLNLWMICVLFMFFFSVWNECCYYLGLSLPLSLKEFPIRISAPLILRWQQSPRMVTVTVSILYGLSRSSLHHGLISLCVVLQDPWCQLLLRFPSMALSGAAFLCVEDWVTFPSFAMFISAQCCRSLLREVLRHCLKLFKRS